MLYVARPIERVYAVGLDRGHAHHGAHDVGFVLGVYIQAYLPLCRLAERLPQGRAVLSVTRSDMHNGFDVHVDF
jgi:hypothetical protein